MIIMSLNNDGVNFWSTDISVHFNGESLLLLSLLVIRMYSKMIFLKLHSQGFFDIVESTVKYNVSYSGVHDDIILPMLQRSWKGGILVSLGTHNKHPIARPNGQAMGCLLWVFRRKLTILSWNHTVFSPHFTSTIPVSWVFLGGCVGHSEPWINPGILD